jgi:hypothetical protein
VSVINLHGTKEYVPLLKSIELKTHFSCIITHFQASTQLTVTREPQAG